MLSLCLPKLNPHSSYFNHHPFNIFPHAASAIIRKGLLRHSGFQEWLPEQQGRVLDPYIDVYEAPSFNAKRTGNLWQDAVVPVLGTTIGEDTSYYNPVWYQTPHGYANSGGIQPVSTRLNEPVGLLPEEGQLAEVTVPFTDAHWSPDRASLVAYRFYFETTHWVLRLVKGIDDESWYAILDDKWDFVYYVPARHLRMVSPTELEPISPDIPGVLKRIEVHLAEQVAIAYEIDQPVFMARIATGGRFRDGNFSTKDGNYSTYHKRPSRHMAAGDLASNGYDLPGVPWICYITESGISFHGTFWHNDFGKPRSHGCINLCPRAARWLYRWTNPIVPANEQVVYQKSGTIVKVIGEWIPPEEKD